MTREEFNIMQFGADMEISYKGNHYQLISVDFDEGLIGYEIGDNDISWARCESVTIINSDN